MPTIDQLITSLTQIIKTYEESENYFEFLRNLHELSTENIQKYYLKVLEFVQFEEFPKEFILNNKTKICLKAKMSQLIIEKDLQDVFPNTCLLLKIYLVVMATNQRRSFFKLKLIFSRLRASMT